MAVAKEGVIYGAQCVLSISRWRNSLLKPNGERFRLVHWGKKGVNMIKGVQAVKGELSGLEKQLSDAFSHEVS